jgi:uncharacterized protein
MKVLNLFSVVIFISFISALPAFAQTQKNPSLEIKGEAHLKVRPDLTVVNISFSAINMVFNKAVKEVNDKNDVLIKQLEKSGFKKSEIKGSSFTAGKNTIWSRDRSIDSGFVASQTVVLEFLYTKERVTKLVEAFTESTVGLAFNFSFILSDSATKTARNKLIELAITDAKEKADLITRTSSTKLGTIQSIQYGNFNNMQPQPLMYKAMENNQSAPAGFGGLNVADIELADEITVLWNISQ